MKQILNKIVSPLSLVLTKGVKFGKENNSLHITVAKGSKKLRNTETAVISHYKPIVKLEL